MSETIMPQPLGAADQFERYTRGLPINEDFSRLRDDPNFVQKQMAEVAVMPRREPLEDVERELERGERLALKELRMSPGWTVLQRLLEKTIHLHRKSVISISEHDPLANKEKIAEQWAYHGALKIAASAVAGLVDAEVKAFDEEAKKR